MFILLSILILGLSRKRFSRSGISSVQLREEGMFGRQFRTSFQFRTVDRSSRRTS